MIPCDAAIASAIPEFNRPESATQSMEPTPSGLPTTFGRYLLRHLLAQGGMAEIFLAEQRGAGDFSKLVVVKRMLDHLCRQPQFVAMFLDEARIASRLTHPNIVQVFDFGEVMGRYYLTMEYLAGEDLGEVIRHVRSKGETVPFQVAVQVMVGACDGLHFAHEFCEGDKPLNVVHRDVSPSNIMISYQGSVKLVDFGIARAADRRQEATQAGAFKGKISYASPEQLQGDELDRRSDLFALGVVFHELITGKRLMQRDTDLRMFQAVLNDPIPLPSSKRNDVPEALDALVMKLLERNPEKRYRTALEVRRDLEKLITGPAPRLDEYLLALFGEVRISERLNVSSKVEHIPTASYDDGKGPNYSGPYGVPAPGDQPTAVKQPPLPPPSTTVAESEPTRALHSPVVEPVVAQPPAPKSKLPWGLLAAGGLGVLILAAGMLSALGLRADPVRVVAEAVAPHPPPLPPAGASLEITTVPPGASVEVGGKPAPGVSPVKVAGLAPGRWPVRATLRGFRPADQVVETRAGETSNLLLTLVQEGATVEVDAPPGAKVAVDGTDRGAERKLELSAGEHTVRVTLPGHRPYVEKVTLAPGETRKLAAQLAAAVAQAPGKLDVSCIPWCRVYVDGKELGEPSPIVGLPIAAGRHTLKMVHPATGRSKEVELTVAPGQPVRESASFQ